METRRTLSRSGPRASCSCANPVLMMGHTVVQVVKMKFTSTGPSVSRASRSVVARPS